jgi:nitrite reductase (NADH) small subunit
MHFEPEQSLQSGKADAKCPHKGGPLSQDIVFGRHVACPLHNWNISLESGQALEPDVARAGMTIK